MSAAEHKAETVGTGRPAHIAPLDDALERHLKRLRDAEENQARIEADYADVLRNVAAAQKARSDAYYAAKSCEDAIRKLGFVVLCPGGTVPPRASRLDHHAGNFRVPVDLSTTSESQAHS